MEASQLTLRRRGLGCLSIFGHILAISTFALTTNVMLYEGNYSSDSLDYGTFKNHPFVMTLGFSVFSTFAVLSFFTYERAFGMNHDWAKYLHFFWQSLAVVTATVGVASMYKVHADADTTHFNSLHSWLGIFMISLYWLQYTLGVVVFLCKKVSPTLKRSFLATHIFFGLTSTFGVYLVILLGLIYHNPGITGDSVIYRDLNLAGICLFATAACVGYIIFDSRQWHSNADRKKNDEPDVRDVQMTIARATTSASPAPRGPTFTTVDVDMGSQSNNQKQASEDPADSDGILAI